MMAKQAAAGALRRLPFHLPPSAKRWSDPAAFNVFTVAEKALPFDFLEDSAEATCSATGPFRLLGRLAMRSTVCLTAGRVSLRAQGQCTGGVPPAAGRWLQSNGLYAMNAGTPYEQITQAIFQEILDQDSVRTIKVDHDITLQGKILRHQIDVYWEFEVGGVKYRTIVQAKDWNKPVDQGELLKLWGVLDDLPGQCRAIVVTRTGYQDGAKRYAHAKDILLFELAEEVSPKISMTDVSYATLHVRGLAKSGQPVQGIVIDVDVYTPSFTNASLHLENAVRSGIEARFGRDLPDFQRSLHWEVTPRDFILYDAEGKQTGTLRDVYASIVEEMRKQGLLRHDAQKVLESTFVKTQSPEMPYVQVRMLTVSVEIQKESYQLTMPSFVGFTLKNLADGTVKKFICRNPLTGEGGSSESKKNLDGGE